MSPQATLPFFSESQHSKTAKSPGRVYGRNAIILLLLFLWGLALLTVGFGLTCVLPDDPRSLFPLEIYRRPSNGV
jgi:hypothetical protein